VFTYGWWITRRPVGSGSSGVFSVDCKLGLVFCRRLNPQQLDGRINVGTVRRNLRTTIVVLARPLDYQRVLCSLVGASGFAERLNIKWDCTLFDWSSLEWMDSGLQTVSKCRRIYVIRTEGAHADKCKSTQQLDLQTVRRIAALISSNVLACMGAIIAPLYRNPF